MIERVLERRDDHMALRCAMTRLGWVSWRKGGDDVVDDDVGTRLNAERLNVRRFRRRVRSRLRLCGSTYITTEHIIHVRVTDC